MKYKIFQMAIKSDLKFMEISEEIDSISMPEHGYKKVYEGDINIKYNSEQEILDSLFELFNIKHPNDFKGHSLSVSDLIILEDRAYYCQPMGWKEIKIKDTVNEGS
jgi:hypothetical protein